MNAASGRLSDLRPPPARWLLLRGLARQRRHWFDFPERLAASLSARVETLDLPGTGERRAELAPWTIEATALSLAPVFGQVATEPWGVMGLSLGGMVALSLAEQFPRAVSHVVVLNASARPSSGVRRIHPLALAELLRAAALRDPEAREKVIYALTTNASPLDIASWAQHAAALSRKAPVSGRSMAAQLCAAARFRVQRVTQPVLVLSARRDRLVSASCSRALALALGAEHHCHPSAGHDLPLDDPHWVIERVQAWLGRFGSITGE